VAANEAGPVTAVVTDAGPLIHLDELDALDLLNGFAEVLVPDAVWREVEHHRPQALRHTGVRLTARTVQLVASPAIDALAPIYALHSGEREALALCLENPSCILLTDDTAARMAAGSLGIVAHGTLGVLIRAVRRGQRTREEVLQLLASIPARTTLHIRPALLTEVVAMVAASSA
jgi:predicted nucleic acid-binding protein